MRTLINVKFPAHFYVKVAFLCAQRCSQIHTAPKRRTQAHRVCKSLMIEQCFNYFLSENYVTLVN